MRTLSSFLSSFLVLFFVLTHHADAQGGAAGALSGTVISDESEEPVPGTAVAVWNATDSTLVTGVISSVNGNFQVLGLGAGTYYVKISALGFVVRTLPQIELRAGAMRHDIGQVRLVVDSSQDNEQVTVRAERPDVEIRSDRTVYNVENQPLTAGGNVIDVLKNVPQVEVDLNDRVSLRGSQNVAVLVNNRSVPLNGEALSSFLKSLPADLVQSVEVIPNPSAKYDPDGMAGILNIVFKQKRESGGASGSVSLSGSTTNSYNGTGSLNYRTGRLGSFSSYSFQYNERASEADQILINRLANPSTAVDIRTESHGLTRAHVLNTSLDYSLNEGNTSLLSLSGIVTLRNGHITEDNSYRYQDNGATVPESSFRASYGGDDWVDMNYSIGYQNVIEPSRHEFSIDARYNSNKIETLRDLTERLYETGGSLGDSVSQLQGNMIENRNRGGVVQVDYVRPLGEKNRLETGYQTELSRINNVFYSETFDMQVGEFQPDLNLNNEFIYDVQTHGLYATLGRTIGRFDAQVGLRAEQTYTEFSLINTGEDFTNNYFSLFPSASVLWTLDETRRLQASYSKRINRPQTWQLNPFGGFEDRLNLQRGNPYLDPQYVHSVELGFSQYASWGVISFSPYYRRTENFIERWMSVDSAGVTTTRFENFESTNTFGAEIVGTYRIKDRFRSFVNISLYQFDLDGSNVEAELTNKAFGWSGHGNATFMILKGLDIQASLYYRGPINISRGKVEDQYQASLALKKSLFNDKGSLSLSVNDVFNTMGFEFYRDDPAYYTDVGWKWLSQQATLAFSYNFGQADNQQRRRRVPAQQDSGGAPGGVGI